LCLFSGSAKIAEFTYEMKAMTTYTPEELNTIAEAPMVLGMAVALVDMGVISSAMEAVALSKQLIAVAQKYPNNSVIQTAFSEEALKSGQRKMKKPEIQPADIESGAVVDQALAAANAALGVVERKATPVEVSQYKEFLYACADAVANAAGSGLFGSGSPKVSDKEAAALAKIKAALTV
jgi:hypothetical protein